MANDDTMWGNIFQKEEKAVQNIYSVLAKIPIFKDFKQKIMVKAVECFFEVCKKQDGFSVQGC